MYIYLLLFIKLFICYILVLCNNGGLKDCIHICSKLSHIVKVCLYDLMFTRQIISFSKRHYINLPKVVSSFE